MVWSDENGVKINTRYYLGKFILKYASRETKYVVAKYFITVRASHTSCEQILIDILQLTA